MGEPEAQKTIYRCGRCGAEAEDGWPPCCETAEAFNQPGHGKPPAPPVEGEAAAGAGPAPVVEREL